MDLFEILTTEQLEDPDIKKTLEENQLYMKN